MNYRAIERRSVANNPLRRLLLVGDLLAAHTRLIIPSDTPQHQLLLDLAALWEVEFEAFRKSRANDD